ncbi:MAG TPA: hypothetical protein VGL58_19305 [Caulobacteraceae bacterium]
MSALSEQFAAACSLEASSSRAAFDAIRNAFAIDGGSNAWFRLWREHCSRFLDLGQADEIVAREFGETRLPAGGQLFVAQTFGALVLAALAKEIAVESDVFCEPSMFDWLTWRAPKAHDAVLRHLGNTVRAINLLPADAFAISELLGNLFQSIYPAALRHLLGEYYTPEWVVDDAASFMAAEGLQAGDVLLDPAAGSGGFAVRMLKSPVCSGVRRVVLSDVSPIAKRFSELNAAVFNTFRRREGLPDVEFKCALADTICDATPYDADGLFATEQRFSLLDVSFCRVISQGDLRRAVSKFEFSSAGEQSAFADLLTRYVQDQFAFLESVEATLICGNPPWISWDGVLPEYRHALAIQWSGSSLITNKGWRAKVAAGKTDLSTLFVHRAAERHAAPRATLAFALPISVFQARHSSAGFRTFRAGPSRRYMPLAVLDLTGAPVFADAANRPSVGIFQADGIPTYPIKYGKLTASAAGAAEYAWQFAQPIDANSQGSPIVVVQPGEQALFAGVGPSEYRARGGVNTGGANTILWLDVLDQSGELVRVQNIGASKRSTARQLKGEIEKSAVARLLLGRDIKRWRAVPSRNLFFLYDEHRPKEAMPVQEAAKRYPRALDYIEKFKGELTSRKEYHRWGGKGPFYELYRIGPYTFSPTKVVWQHTGFRGRMNIAVIEDSDARIIPDQKVIMLSFSDSDEAHYACAYMASRPVERILGKYLGIDASTHVLDFVAMKRFDPANPLHRRLSTLSREAHRRAAARIEVDTVEKQIDAVAEELFVRGGEALESRLTA